MRYEDFPKWPPTPSVDLSLTVGQAMVILAALEDDRYPLNWGRNRRAAIRAKILAALPEDARERLASAGRTEETP